LDVTKPMSDLDIDALIAPLAGDTPCGANLEYEPAFEAMQQACLVKPETQYGSVITPAQPPDWPTAREHALNLATRTRDLRVAVCLVRAGARLEGFERMAQGLRLLSGLVETQWAGVHPQLDHTDNDDPTARLSALAPLIHGEGLADLRAAGLTSARGAVTVRDIELAFGRADPLPGEPLPTAAGVLPAIVAAQAQSPGLAAAMTGALEAVRALGRTLDARLGAGSAPDFAPLLKLLSSVADAGREAQGEAGPAGGEAGGPAVAAATPRVSGAIESREDAIRALQRVSEWIERNEPSNPAPLLIQRAERLMRKTNFLDIIRDLLPEGLPPLEKLAGPGRE
jgi:type VI secretion system protein ImpA